MESTVKVTITIQLSTGRKLKFTEEEYEALKQKFEIVKFVPQYPVYPISPQPDPYPYPQFPSPTWCSWGIGEWDSDSTSMRFITNGEKTNG